MARQPKDYSVREKEAAKAGGGAPSLFAQVAGPLIVALLLAGLAWGIDSLRADLRHDERISVLAGQIDKLEATVKVNTEARLKGERWTKDDAIELQKIVTELRITVEGLKRRQTP